MKQKVTAGTALPADYSAKDPERATALPGTFWAVTAFFNPAGYVNKYDNYRVFREKTKAQGLRLMSVELAFNETPFRLCKEDADILVQIRGDDRNIMWQKERLLNIGLTHLPENCDKVCFVDSDIVFTNDNWIHDTSVLLERYAAIQPFKTARNLKRSDEKEGDTSNGLAYMLSMQGRSKFNFDGQPGYAWAMRRSSVENYGLYDRCIMGYGDLCLIWALYDISPRVYSEYFTREMITDILKWRDGLHSKAGGRVYYAPGDVLHLFHGKKARRLYGVRNRVLDKFSFDPSSDIRLGKNGVYEWASDKPVLHSLVKEYFTFRLEGSNNYDMIAFLAEELDKAILLKKRFIYKLEHRRYRLARRMAWLYNRICGPVKKFYHWLIVRPNWK